jgi:hypothetical protein
MITRKVAIKKLHNMHYESFSDITDLLMGYWMKKLHENERSF